MLTAMDVARFDFVLTTMRLQIDLAGVTLERSGDATTTTLTMMMTTLDYAMMWKILCSFY